MPTEFEFITNLRKRSAEFSQTISRVGIGDDCAVLPKNARTDLVVTADLLVEDVDFRLDWTKPEFVGHKALAVSLSDVAAMGASPTWAMTSIGVPAAVWETDFVEKFYRGWFALARKFGVGLVGGDVSRTPDKIVVDSIVAGEVGTGKAILRSGARAGDAIFVTGRLGGAAAGLELLQAGEKYEGSKYRKTLLRQLKPNPQTEIGKILGRSRLVSSMIDLSDGLSGDLAHLCRASGVGAQIFADRIPLERKFSPAEKTFGEKLRLALDGGEDFELLFTANPKKILRLEKALENFRFSRIGEITANADIIELTDGENSRVLEPKGFRHF